MPTDHQANGWSVTAGIKLPIRLDAAIGPSGPGRERPPASRPGASLAQLRAVRG